MQPLTDADLRRARAALAADCSRCRALCCIGPAFTRSADFPLSKPAGVPCPNLGADHRCGVHDRLLAGGFRGCIGYDCFGAGQRIVAALGPGDDGPPPDPTGYALLPVVRLLHELEWYLLEVLARPGAAATHPRAGQLLTTTRELAARIGPGTGAAALAALAQTHRHEVAPVLRAASVAVRAAAGGTGQDHAGADLAGAALPGADLRRADLRGAVLIGADLQRADLRGADLLGADTRGARLDGADLRDTLFLTRTQLDAAGGDRVTHLARMGGTTGTLARVTTPPPQPDPQPAQQPDPQADPRRTAPDGRPRARGIGVPFPGEPGPLNAITDVPGVEVGSVTLIEGDGALVVGAGPVRTGVTAILPRGRAGVGVPCAAGWYSLNGNGEMTGTTWIEEVGALALPVVVSNTHAVGACHTGTVEWVARTHPAVAAEWLLPVVAETWDGYLNDINGGHVRPEHAVAALDGAASGPVAEGSVGGGTGMNCYAYKGGSGTASRVVRHGTSGYTVGAFVQANFGDRSELTIAGVRLGGLLADDDPMADPGWLVRDVARAAARTPGAVRSASPAFLPSAVPPGATRPPGGAGSVIVVVATDAPLLPGQCKALARRVPLGLARTGTSGGHFSGDIFLAFSTANPGALRSRIPVAAAADDDYDTLRFVPWGRMDPFFAAVVECIEEAVLNALVVNADMVGRDGHRSPALPHDAVRRALRAAGVLGS